MATMPNSPEPDFTASDTDLPHRGAATETQGSEPDIEVDAPRNVGAPAPKTEPSQEEPAAKYEGFKTIASRMVALGIPVIPLQRRTKDAFLKDWPSRATTDMNQIERWNKKNFYYNCGSVAKTNGIWILDADSDGLIDQIERETGRKLPRTLVVQSSRPYKQHWYFWQNDASRKMGNIPSHTVDRRFDVKQHNGYVVSPGSIHPDTGQPYRVVIDAPIVEAPDWLCEWLKKQKQTTKQGTKKPAQSERTVSEGARNTYLARVAGRMRFAGVSPEALEQELQRVNLERCRPPLSQSEVNAIARSISRYEPGVQKLDKTFPLTDLGNAERFVHEHGQDLRYCESLGGWLVWGGTRWVHDVRGRVMQLAASTIRGILVSSMNEGLEPDDRKKLFKHALKSEQEPRLQAMIKLARYQPGISVEVKEFDSDPMLLNVRNGTIDLREITLRPHRREDLITRLAPVEYSPTAECPNWLMFLEQITGGDKELAGFLQRATGYTLTGLTVEHSLFLLYGTGSNGKTTYLETLGYVLGEYAGQADFESFTASARGRNARNDLAMLRGKRMVKATESDEGSRIAESFIKQITGGDTVTARFLYREFFEFIPEFKLWLATNHRPEVRGTDDGIWRRIRLIPFTVRIPDERRDKDLLEKLKRESAGILRWAIDGLRAYQQQGLGEPKAVVEATRQYRNEQDVIANFLSATCVMKPGAQVRARVLYTKYRDWVTNSGEQFLMNERSFSQALAQRPDLRKVELSTGNFWQGIALAHHENPDLPL